MAPSAPGPCGAAAFVSGAPLTAAPQRRAAAGACRRPVGAAPAARRGARPPQMGPDTAAAAAPAGADAPLEPVPSRAGRVKVRRGWSNVTGELIRRVCDDVWVVERAYDWLTVDVGGKTTVIRLPDGSLFVHAPLLLTASLKASLAALGPVSVIVVSNKEHVDCAAQWVAAYPDAVSLAPPGYAITVDTPYTGDVPADNTPHPAFQGVIEHTFMGGMPLFAESVFFHIPSGTLLATDLYWNWPAGVPRRTRVFAAGMDWVYKPVYEAFLVRDKARWQAELERVLAWGGERIIPCHGVVEEGVDVAGVMRAFYASMLKE